MSTYFVYDHHEKEEQRRLTIQDQMITEAMGGILSEQANPSVFGHVLDIGCGSGNWLIETAKTYPEIETLIGIDISQKMIEYARTQAKANKVSNQVDFRVMDALRRLEFPSDSFDIVNLRFGVSFIRKWEWPEVVSEMIRVTRSGGVVRITDSGIVQHSNSVALKMFQGMVCGALNRAGHLFGEEELGIIPHLASMLKRYGVREVLTKGHTKTYEADQTYREDICHAMKTLKPFIQKWGSKGMDYEQICQMTREQINQPDFYAIWQLLTAWGIK